MNNGWLIKIIPEYIVLDMSDEFSSLIHHYELVILHEILPFQKEIHGVYENHFEKDHIPAFQQYPYNVFS